MAYPSLVQVYGSEQLDDGGFSTSRTVGGALKIRSYYSSDVRQFVVLHDENDTGKGSLASFYATNKKLTFDFVWAADGATYSCRFLAAPVYTPTAGGQWNIKVHLEVV